jgi:outer membrane protein assembly factor BamB
MLAIAVLAMLGSAAQAADWPQWRGPLRDAKSTETGLLKAWPKEGPPIAWQTDGVGIGYSSLVVADGRVITMGDLDGIEHIIALNEKDGSLLWAVQPEPVKAALALRVAEQFDKFDLDRNGKLDELEALNGLGWNFNDSDVALEGNAEAIAKARVAALLKLIDKNEDGQLTADEFPNAMIREAARIDREDKAADGIELATQRAEALLAAADEDLDDKVSREEAKGKPLETLFNQMDEKSKETNKGDGVLTLEEIRGYLFAKEPGRDGAITPAELTAYYLQRYPNKDGQLEKDDLLRQFGGYRNGTGDGPRGTPTVEGDRVYAEGGNGDLTCLAAASGKTIWHLNLSNDLKGGRPGWGYCESPLVTGQEVIVTPGGSQGTIAAIDKQTGKVLWRSTGLTDGAHYSSPQVATIAGVKQIVQFTRSSVFGLTLDGAHILWQYSGANNGTANIATPIVSDDLVLSSSAYGTGTGLVKVSTTTSTEQKADEVFFNKELANHHGGLVKVGDYVYGFGNKGLMCLKFDTGEVQWKARSVSKGSLIFADGMLYCLGEGHEVALVEANPEKYVETGRFKIESQGRPAWAHPVVANGRFYIRDQGVLTAYDVKAK